MHSEMDEARITAFALGELHGDEQATVEAFLATSEDSRREVEEIREVAAALRKALGEGARHELTLEQRGAIAEALARQQPPRSLGFGHLPKIVRVGTALLATAAVLVAVLLLPTLRPARVSIPPARLGETPMPSTTLPPTSPQLSQSQEYAERLRGLGYTGGDVDGARVEPWQASSAPYDTEAYDHTAENPFILVAQDPRSTFSVDVDTASYANIRRFLNGGALPPKDAVRIEEMVNYFPYTYSGPTDGRPFAVHMEAASCPWMPGHRLVRIAIKGREVSRGERPPANLVFLLDVSGSMAEPNKLPLVKAAMRLLVNQLGPSDRVAIVVYAGAEGLVLPPTPATDKTAILSAIESLSPGGMTHGSAGIRLAYDTAAEYFIRGGINRVILATDGDFNVGITSRAALIRLIEEKAKSGVFLTTLGFGMGNLKDSTLEGLADHGNGNYAYIDGLSEARKVFVEQIGSTLETIAKDVKLQIEFNPLQVKAFRLLGYENRILAHRDFNNDKKDAGDIGAGHTVTAFYEIVPAGSNGSAAEVDSLKYQHAPQATGGNHSAEVLTLKLRYKQPTADQSSLMEVALKDDGASFRAAAPEFRFAAAVAAFGMILRESPHKGDADLAKVVEWAGGSVGDDKGGLRREFLQLVENARALQSR